MGSGKEAVWGMLAGLNVVGVAIVAIVRSDGDIHLI